MEVNFVKDNVLGGESTLLRKGETFSSWLDRFEMSHPQVSKLYIYEITATDVRFCDQGCKIGEKGCKEFYTGKDASIIIRFSKESHLED